MKQSTLQNSATNVLYQLFQNTSDAAFGIDKQSRVRFWNDACEKLLGLSFKQVENEKCYSVLSGTDLDGSPLCGPDCHASKKILNGRPVSHYDLMVKGADEDSLIVNVGAYITPEMYRERTDTAAFFVLRRIDCYRLLKRMSDGGTLKRNEYKPDSFRLTSRELQILDLASKGVSTIDIANQLFISTITVRNHFKNIFCKLDVHTRAEAVSLALRNSFFQ